MSELRELYQEVILDHNKHPRNFGVLEGARHSAEGHNPLCGDRIKVYLQLDGDRISDVSFEGNGCAISKASASIMTEVVRGRPVEEVERLFRSFHRLMTSDLRAEIDPGLGKLEVFAGVREFPIRVKCATLPWHTLQAALHHQPESVTTE